MRKMNKVFTLCFFTCLFIINPLMIKNVKANTKPIDIIANQVNIADRDKYSIVTYANNIFMSVRPKNHLAFTKDLLEDDIENPLCLAAQRNIDNGMVIINEIIDRQSTANANNNGSNDTSLPNVTSPIQQLPTPKINANNQATTAPKVPTPNVVTQPATSAPQIVTPKPTQPATSAPQPAAPSNNTASGKYADFQRRVVELVNSERAKSGLSPLSENASLDNCATVKSEDMVKMNYFSHQSPTYGSPFDMLSKFNIVYSYAGENIAYGQSSAEEVMNGWMNSSGHRANILNVNFTQIGVGIAQKANGQLVWTQQFIKP